ncbi:hypothetical protein D3C73_1432670 [compost metagenome]
MKSLIHTFKIHLDIRMSFLKRLHHILKNIQHLLVMLLDPEVPEGECNFLRLLLFDRFAAIIGDD